MPWKGELQRDVPFTIDVGGDINDKNAITIIKINQRGGTHVRTVTVPSGAAMTIHELLGPRIVRMIVQADPPPGGRMTVAVSQGSTQFTDTIEGDVHLVWNAVA